VSEDENESGDIVARVRRLRALMNVLIGLISLDSFLILLSVPASPYVAIFAVVLCAALIAGVVLVQRRLSQLGSPFRWPWNETR